MFKKALATAAASICTAVLLNGSALAAGFNHLSFVSEYRPTHPVHINSFQPFFKAAQEAFPGKNGLSYDSFYLGELFPEAENLAALTDGRGDFVMFRTGSYPGKFKLADVLCIPGMFPNPLVGGIVAEEVMTEFPEVRAELPQNSTPFAAWTSAEFQFHMTHPVKSVDEIKGKKILVWDALSLEMVKALGANPIRMASADIYLALSKGMADGVFCPLAPCRSLKITEAAKYHVMLNAAVYAFIMNVHTPLWESFPKEMKDWLQENGHKKLSFSVGKSLFEGEIADIEALKKDGHEFYYYSDEVRNETLKPLAAFKEDWKKRCSTYPPELVEKVLNFCTERSRYHTEQMRAGAYGKYEF